MFSEHFYPCDRNEDRKSVQWMFLPQLPETGESWNKRELEQERVGTSGGHFSPILELNTS